MSYTIGPAAGSPEWYAYRKYDPSRSDQIRFGASISGALLGVHPYCSRLDLFCQMTGRIDDDESLLMDCGKALEPVVIGAYEAEVGCKVTVGHPMYLSTKYPLLSATPDGIREDCRILVEAKTADLQRYRGENADETQFGIEGTDSIPLEYLAQTQHQMAVMDYDVVDMPVVFSNRKLRIYHVTRRQEIIDAIVEASESMAECLRTDSPPPPDYGRAGERALLLSLGESAESVTLPAEIEELWVQCCECKDKIKDLTLLADSLTDRVVEACGGAAFGVLPGLQRQLKRINVSACSYTVNRKPYSYYREVKLG
jgi:putative phage-type endonuclease